MKNIYCKIAIVLLLSILLSCNFEDNNSTQTQSLHPIESKSSNISFDGTEFQKTSFATVIPNGKTATIPAGNCTLTGYVFVTGRTVTLSSYEMGQCEVTEELYEAVTGSLPSKMEMTDTGEVTKLRPVVGLTAGEAFKFCNALSEKMGYDSVYSDIEWTSLGNYTYCTTVKLDMTKNGYRLPTEAEWEYAARGAGLTTEDWNYKYSGNDKIKKVAWCSYNSTGTSDEIEEGITHEVGIKKPNALYLYDMSGNASEWCQDFDLYCSAFYGSGSIPTGLEGNSVVPEKFESNIDPYLNTPQTGGGRVKRGGSYADTNELDCREHQYEYWSSNEIGIRLVRRPYDNE